MRIQWKSWLFRLRLVFVLIILIAIFSIISPAFLTPENIYNVFWSVAVVGIMTVGANYVILVAGIDLSVGAVASISGILMANFMLSFNVGVLWAILTTLAVGALIGFLNGEIIIRFQLPDFIVTLVSMGIINGIAMALTGGETLGILKPPGFLFIGLGRLAGVPIPVYIFLFAMAMGYCVLNFTVFGRRLFAVGGNKVASRLSGVPVNKVITLAYTSSGITAAAAGIVLSSMTQQASSLMARGYELDVIAVPTHKPMIRKDRADSIYKSIRAK